MLSAKEVAALAAKALDAKMGEDIRLIGITDISTLADFFLICTATSSTHVKTLCDAVEEAMDEAGEPMLSREGHRGGTWVLMDFGSLVVHVFTAEARKFYDLERLWQDGHQVNLAAVLGEKRLTNGAKKTYNDPVKGREGECPARFFFRDPAAGVSRENQPDVSHP